MGVAGLPSGAVPWEEGLEGTRRSPFDESRQCLAPRLENPPPSSRGKDERAPLPATGRVLRQGEGVLLPRGLAVPWLPWLERR